MSEDEPSDHSSGDRRRRVVAGGMTVEVADERAGPRPAPQALDLARWGRLAAAAAQAEGAAEPAELGLAFVDEAAIAALAGRWLDSPRPTDVLAFPLDGSARRDGAGGPPQLIGDVVVCPAVAARQALAARRPLDDELALLVVHGVLHLLGHDHARRGEARRMQRRTRDLLAQHHSAGDGAADGAAPDGAAGL